MSDGAGYCINRNIMECKDSDKRNTIETNYGINRNIMECKEIASMSKGDTVTLY